MNTAAFGKTMKNVTKHREIKLAKSQEGINWYQNQTTLFVLKFAQYLNSTRPLGARN